MHDLSSLIDSLRKRFHESYGAHYLTVQLELSHLESIENFPFDNIEAQLCLRATEMNVENSKRCRRSAIQCFTSRRWCRSKTSGICQSCEITNVREVPWRESSKGDGHLGFISKIDDLRALSGPNEHIYEILRDVPAFICPPQLTGGTRRSSNDLRCIYFRLLVPEKWRGPPMNILEVWGRRWLTCSTIHWTHYIRWTVEDALGAIICGR